jgi:hypothetical protein
MNTKKETIYRITIKIDTFSKPVTIFAEDVDLLNLPLVTIKKIRRGVKSSLLTIPTDEGYEKFKNTKTLIVPYSNLIMAEEIEDKEDKVVSILDKSKDK